MKPPLEHIRLSKQARDQLVTLKRYTGVKNWNVLCRWAFSLSIGEPTIPLPPASGGEPGVEMAWSVFAGEQADCLNALLRWRCHKDSLDPDDATLGLYLKAHIQRGLGYMTADKRIRNVADLIALASR
jgi:DNA sulfur modification protein DndE